MTNVGTRTTAWAPQNMALRNLLCVPLTSPHSSGLRSSSVCAGSAVSVAISSPDSVVVHNLFIPIGHVEVVVLLIIGRSIPK
jgi:hypothetical protein